MDHFIQEYSNSIILRKNCIKTVDYLYFKRGYSMSLKSRIDSIVKYSLIISVYYLTGGAFSARLYNIKVISMFFIILFIVLFYKRNKVTNFFLSIAILFLMISLILLVPIINSEINLGPYFAIPLQLSIGFLMCLFITFEEFKDKYINIIIFFASASLIGYTISLLYPRIIYFFPVTIGDASVDYYDALIYVFMKSKGYASDALVLTTRNAGICWEPGAYQIFLNLGILFLLDNGIKGKNINKFQMKLMILIITLFTTFSTTGYIVLFLLLTSYRKIVFSNIKKDFFISTIIVFVSIVFMNLIMLRGVRMDFIFQKIRSEFSEFGAGAIDRISLTKIKYQFDKPLYFFGMSFSTWLEYKESMWNSIIHTSLSLGVPFTTIMLYLYYMFSKHFNKRCLLVFLIFIMSFSTETLFWRTFFNYLAFSGLLHQYKLVYKEELF